MTKAVERLAELGAGEVIRGNSLLGREGRGLTDEPIEAEVRSVSSAGAVTLDIRFMGVKLATAAAKPDLKTGKIAWMEAK